MTFVEQFWCCFWGGLWSSDGFSGIQLRYCCQAGQQHSLVCHCCHPEESCWLSSKLQSVDFPCSDQLHAPCPQTLTRRFSVMILLHQHAVWPLPGHRTSRACQSWVDRRTPSSQKTCRTHIPCEHAHHVCTTAMLRQIPDGRRQEKNAASSRRWAKSTHARLGGPDTQPKLCSRAHVP